MRNGRRCPRSLHLTGGSARAMAEVLEGLEVDAARMRERDRAGRRAADGRGADGDGARTGGRARGGAGDRRPRGASTPTPSGVPLARALREDPAVVAHLSADDLEVALTPEQDLGSTPVLVARVLARHDARRAAVANPAATLVGVPTPPRRGPEDAGA